MKSITSDRYIAVVRDGGTDFAVIAQFIRILLEKHGIYLIENAILELQPDLNFREDVDKYFRSTKNYELFEPQAKILRDAIFDKILSAFYKFQDEIPRGTLYHRDLLILYTDTERVLSQNQDYFKEWAYSIQQNFYMAIDQFYDRIISRGYSYLNLPLILPMVFFPSSEVLVVVSENTPHRSKKAKELKELMYGETNLSKFDEEEFKEMALKNITSDKLEKIYQELPEIQKWIQFIAFYQ